MSLFSRGLRIFLNSCILPISNAILSILSIVSFAKRKHNNWAWPLFFTFFLAKYTYLCYDSHCSPPRIIALQIVTTKHFKRYCNFLIRCCNCCIVNYLNELTGLSLIILLMLRFPSSIFQIFYILDYCGGKAVKIL